MSILQNAWNLDGKRLNRQKRRSELVKKCLSKKTKKVLDIGCAEGFTTKYITDKCKYVVGIELDFDNLRVAKQKLKEVFITTVQLIFFHSEIILLME
jgi:2-polyprenyl-3-methyl-5-hydroxy-6-metoxy-1,4-benzoquinol methylase